MNVARTLQLLKRSGASLTRSSPQGGLVSVRNAGHAKDWHPDLPPLFPPGARQIEQARNWMGSAAMFGATAFAALCYFSDWKVVVAYIPFYNGKFKED